MAVGRIPESTLKVFGNDYPGTVYVMMKSSWIHNLIIFNAVTEPVLGTICTSWILLLVTSLP